MYILNWNICKSQIWVPFKYLNGNFKIIPQFCAIHPMYRWENCRTMNNTEKKLQLGKIFFFQSSLANELQDITNCKKTKRSLNQPDQQFTWYWWNRKLTCTRQYPVDSTCQHQLLFGFKTKQLVRCDEGWSSKLSAGLVQCLGHNNLNGNQCRTERKRYETTYILLQQIYLQIGTDPVVEG